MRAEGVELLAEVSDLAVMGFSGLPRLLPYLARLRKQILKEAVQRRTRLALLVDYPGFNLNLAAALKRLPAPPRVMQYIAPQLWAWRAGRINRLRAAVDQLAVVFPFEVELFHQAGIPVAFVGHPLIDELKSYQRLKTSAVNSPPLLALLPGSRRSVARRHLPVMLQAAREVRSRWGDLHIAMGCAPNLSKEFFSSHLEPKENIELTWDSRELLARADATVVCSGTSTLEAALLDVPQIVIYRTSALNYQIIRRLIKVQRISLVNIVAGCEVVPELIQKDFKAKPLADRIMNLLLDDGIRQKMLQGYTDVRKRLGSGGAAENAAKLALSCMTAV